MSDTLRWLLTIEIVAAAFLPFTVWLARSLPDRGYPLAKLFGLLAVTYGTWLIGHLFPVVGGATVPAVLAVAAGSAAWWWAGRNTWAELTRIRRVVLIEEALFLLVFLIWTVLRANYFHPGIGHTEQYMDLAFLEGSLRSTVYPPYDPWMSGHTINYYYVGYLLYATTAKLAAVGPWAAYNLALSSVFAFTVVGAFSVAYALCRRLVWAFAGPLLLAIIGNWYALLVQLPRGVAPPAFAFLWDSTRVVGGNNNIDEFPYFSFLLGDLHPHVMALPVTILVIGLVAAIVQEGTVFSRHRPDQMARLAMAALVAGSLFAINSWDFPAYLALVGAGLAVNSYLNDASVRWWTTPAVLAPAIAAVGVIGWLPFYAHYRGVASGVGRVTTPSDLGQFLQFFGPFLVPIAGLLLILGMLLQPTRDDETEATPAVERAGTAMEFGAVSLDTVLFGGALLLFAVIIGVRFHQWVLILLALTAAAAANLLARVLNTAEPNRADALALMLVLLGCLVAALPEVVYLRDAFDGGSNYRMNTVFKFYYQVWTMWSLAAGYGLFRSFTAVRRLFGPALGALPLAVGLVGLAGGLVYTVGATQSASLGGSANSLDASSVLAATEPGDEAAINWLDQHARGNPVVLEATPGGDYLPPGSRISTFSGLPTVLGWGGHESQWRGPDPEIALRTSAINRIYTTNSTAVATKLLHQYHVQYVVVGSQEQAIPHVQLAKFRHFLQPVFHSSGTTIYSWGPTAG